MKRIPYAVLVLRYVHDVVSGEFVNVGVMMISEDSKFRGFKTLTRTARISRFFPGASTRAITASLRLAKELFVRQQPDADTGDTSLGEQLVRQASKVLPIDDSAFQWSQVTVGLSKDAEATFSRLFDRLVLRYIDKYEHQKKTDEQVWRTFDKALASRQISARLQEHKVEADLETVTFAHAVKNGKWHLMEPVSFDLAHAESVKDKAKRILGEMTLLRERREDFKLYFLVGQPSEEDALEAYDSALRILKEVPCESVIYQESQAEQFAHDLAKSFVAH